MAIARKTTKPAAPAAKKPPVTIDAQPIKLSEATVSVAPPAMLETVDASLGNAEDLQAQVRRTAEQSRLVFERLKSATEDATGTLETSFAVASKGLSEFHSKAVEVIKVNSDANLDFLKALFGTKSLSEAIALQGEYSRMQFETFTTQVKDLGSLFQRVATEAVEPLKATFAKNLQA